MTLRLHQPCNICRPFMRHMLHDYVTTTISESGSAQINQSLDFIFIFYLHQHLVFSILPVSAVTPLLKYSAVSLVFYCKQSMQLCCHYYSEGVSQEQHYIQHFKKTDLSINTTANPALVLICWFVGLVLLGLVQPQHTEALSLGLCWLFCLILILINFQLYY